jgi:hypothetical protein
MTLLVWVVLLLLLLLLVLKSERLTATTASLRLGGSVYCIGD